MVFHGCSWFFIVFSKNWISTNWIPKELDFKELASKELGVLGYSDLLGMQWHFRLFRSIGNAMAFPAIPIYWECNGVLGYSDLLGLGVLGYSDLLGLGVPMSGRFGSPLTPGTSG